jgi:hypothetical protein
MNKAPIKHKGPRKRTEALTKLYGARLRTVVPPKVEVRAVATGAREPVPKALDGL